MILIKLSNDFVVKIDTKLPWTKKEPSAAPWDSCYPSTDRRMKGKKRKKKVSRKERDNFVDAKSAETKSISGPSCHSQSYEQLLHSMPFSHPLSFYELLSFLTLPCFSWSCSVSSALLSSRSDCFPFIRPTRDEEQIIDCIEWTSSSFFSFFLLLHPRLSSLFLSLITKLERERNDQKRTKRKRQCGWRDGERERKRVRGGVISGQKRSIMDFLFFSVLSSSCLSTQNLQPDWLSKIVTEQF